MQPFKPLFRDPHLQTLLGHFWKCPLDTVRYPVERRLYRTEPEVQVLVESQQPQGIPEGQIVMVHGLEGSGEAGYMRSLSAAALEAGYGVHRFHMRTCGGTEHPCQTLYHAGLTSDLLRVVEQMAADGRAPVWLVGFSLGGNVVLKLAGELGERAAGLVRGVCGASTPLDLDRSVRRLEHWDNRVYEMRFVRRMRRRLIATGRYTAEDFRGLRSVRDIDEHITAPSFGFRDAAHYYQTQSAIRFLEAIRVPALLVQSRDDTYIPAAIFDDPAVRANPRVDLLMTDHGGHLGFVERRGPRYWLDRAVLQWMRANSGTKAPLSASMQESE